MSGNSPIAEHDGVYSRGPLRHHHLFYLQDGNFVMQVSISKFLFCYNQHIEALSSSDPAQKVESAIFKVHRFFPAKFSGAIKDKIGSPKGTNDTGDGTDERPVVLTGDSASGWELLLEDIYDIDRYASIQPV